jgi:hypothetical protein
VDRCALFVDAGYALADGAMVVHGTSRKDSVSWNHAGLLTLLAGLAKDRTGLPVLRCYWYEVAADGRRTPEQDALAEMPGLKLRLVNSRPGRREGVDAQMRRDLVTLAKSGAISDAFIASADEHLAEIVAEVQDLGMRVVVLHISADGAWTIPQQLRQECDDIVEISGVHLRPFVELIRGAEPAMAIEAYPVPAESRATDSAVLIGSGAQPHVSAEHAMRAAAASAPPSSGSAYLSPSASVLSGPPVNAGAPANPAATPAVPTSASADAGRSGYTDPGAIVPGVDVGSQAGQQGQTLSYDRSQSYPAAGSPPSAASYPNEFDGPRTDDLSQATQYGSAGSSLAPGSAAGVPPGDRPWPAPSASDYGAGEDAGTYGGSGQNGRLPQASPANGTYPVSESHNGAGQSGIQNGAVRGGGAPNGPALNGGALNGSTSSSPINWGSPISQPPAAAPARYEAVPGYQQQVPGSRDARFGPRPATGPGPGSGQGEYGGFAAGQAQQGRPPQHAQGQQGPPPHAQLQQGPPPHAQLQQGPPPHAQPPHAQLQQGPPPHAQLQQGPPPPHAQLQQGPPQAQVQQGGPGLAPLAQPGPALAYQDHYAAQSPPALQSAIRPMQPAQLPLPDAVKAAHAEGFQFGESVGRDAPGLWLEAVLARKPRMPSDLEARLLQGSALPIDSLLHDEVRHSLRRGFWDALEMARR